MSSLKNLFIWFLEKMMDLQMCYDVIFYLILTVVSFSLEIIFTIHNMPDSASTMHVVTFSIYTFTVVLFMGFATIVSTDLFKRK